MGTESRDDEIMAEWEGPNPPPEWKSQTIIRAQCGPDILVVEEVIRHVPGGWRLVRISRVEKVL